MNASGMCTGNGMKQIESPTPKAAVMLRRCSDQRRGSMKTCAKGRANQRSREACTFLPS